MCVSQLAPAGALNWAAVYAGDGLIARWVVDDPPAATMPTPAMSNPTLKATKSNTTLRIWLPLRRLWGTLDYVISMHAGATIVVRS
jgi:hypothetical protein